MFTSALLAVLATVSVSPDERTAPPEKPVFVAPLQKKMADQPVGDPFTADAQLCDVCFVDPQIGWAVGDRGAIWHTDNGGKTWTRQDSGVRATLNSVCFLDDRIGFAAGGFAVPYSHRGVGVLLTTRDGGQTWNYNPRIVLPAASLLGAVLVLLADTVGRSVAAPLQLPVGALMAVVGVPVFVWQLQRP